MQQPLQQHIEAIGTELLAEAKAVAKKHGPAEKWLHGLLARIGEDAAFRTQALRFIDVLPVLASDRELARHLQEYFGAGDFPLPAIAQWGAAHAAAGPLPHLVAPAVRQAVEWIGKRFIAGHSIDEAWQVIEGLHDAGMTASLDLLGEAVLSEAGAAAYQRQYLELTERLAPRLAARGMAPNLSLKVSSLYSQIDAAAFEHSVAAVKERLRPILRAVKTHGGKVCLDMEHYEAKGITLAVFRDILNEAEFADWDGCGIALQAYLKDTQHDLKALLAWAEQRGTPAFVRLVRGAYWDTEVVVAERQGWPCPVFRQKAETDQNYERCLKLLLEQHALLRPAIASHNVRSLALALALIDEHGLTKKDYEFQMLYGMAEEMKAVLINRGHPLTVYVPIGPIIPGMAYLVRRLLENSASVSFLRLAFIDERPAAELLAAPVVTAKPAPRATPVFANEPVHRFTDTGERQAMRAAIDTVRGRLGKTYPLILGGRRRETGKGIVSVNPAKPAEVIGEVAAAEEHHVEEALQAATASLASWRRRPAAERASLLRAAASLLRQRRDEFAAWEILEAAKPWREADADVTEAIDYLTYYAAEAEHLAAGHRFDVPGEQNRYRYQPLGVAAIIPPWNFPLAITTGMLAAAVVSGNTVILKPSSQTPVIAHELVALLAEAGAPDGVVNYLPGAGSDIGDVLVAHPGVHLIAFTGSRAIGCRIHAEANADLARQDHIKRVIAEMGGKNAILVDVDADLDDAVAGIIASAFGYCGQKCSAASRLIVVGEIFEELLARLIEAARSLTIGPPERPETFMGPVISEEAMRRIAATAADGAKQAKPVLQVEAERSQGGFYVGPTIFTEVPESSPLACEEIFGPVLAVMHAEDFEHALAMANRSRYALTGGVYSRSPAHLQRAADAFNVGNLYLNRKITGAVVGRQPFGGFKMSGSGFKAGGPDYLLQFVQAKTVTENTLRRGFAPWPNEEVA